MFVDLGTAITLLLLPLEGYKEGLGKRPSIYPRESSQQHNYKKEIDKNQKSDCWNPQFLAGYYPEQNFNFNSCLFSPVFQTREAVRKNKQLLTLTWMLLLLNMEEDQKISCTCSHHFLILSIIYKDHAMPLWSLISYATLGQIIKVNYLLKLQSRCVCLVSVSSLGDMINIYNLLTVNPTDYPPWWGLGYGNQMNEKFQKEIWDFLEKKELCLNTLPELFLHIL